jgi:transposase
MDRDDESLRPRAVAMRREGRSRREIREALGVGQARLTRLLDGEPSDPALRRPRAKDDLRDRARALRREGRSIAQIARELGVPRGSVSRWTSAGGTVAASVEAVRGPKPETVEGAQQPATALPVGQGGRDHAIALRRAGHSRSQICAALGVGRRLLDEWLVGVPVPEWTRRPTAKDNERRRALRLREEGWSYGRIAREVGVSKASVAHWVKHVPVEITEEQRLERLRSAEKRRAQTARRRASARRQQAKLTASRDVSALSDRELFLLGVGLYWSEGAKDKPERHTRQEQVTFVNSDPDMVRVFLAWLSLLGFGGVDLGFRLQIHETADVGSALQFWADVVGVPAEEFGRTTLKRHHPATTRHNTGDRYRGCLAVSVRRSSELYRAIEGWWCGIAAGVRGQAYGETVRWGPRAPATPSPWGLRRVRADAC